MSGSTSSERPQTSSSSYTTPTKRAAFQSEAGPSRPAGSSPAYVTVRILAPPPSPRTNRGQNLRRHSLYGTEDRVVIDPGSRLWKVGFSGEPRPRAVFRSSPGFEEENEMWDLDIDKVHGAEGSRDEAERLVAARIRRRLREVFSKHLMTDAKSRKVIIVENAFLPLIVKEHITRTLFQNLKIPSLSFVPSHVLALTAIGRPTGLVIDCGYLETTIMPVRQRRKVMETRILTLLQVFASRPMYSNVRSTVLAGRALSQRLRALLLNFATYVAPPAAIGSSSPPPRPVPEGLLTDQVVEMVLTQGCFVGSVVADDTYDNSPHSVPIKSRTRRSSLGAGTSTGNERVPYSPGEVPPASPMIGAYDESKDEQFMAPLQRRYEKSSTASNTVYKIPPGLDSPVAMSFGSLLVPGWIRERAAEVLFEVSENGEDASLPGLVLDALLKLPLDLRVPMVTSVLVCGGTASLPGFIPRLRVSILRGLSPPTSSTSPSSRPSLPSDGPVSADVIKASNACWRTTQLEAYQALYPLANKLTILNDPIPLESGGSSSGGKAPCWTPGLMAWVGASLAGSLKTGGAEVLREYFDEAVADAEAKASAATAARDDEMERVEALIGKKGFRVGRVVPDWSRVLVA